MMFKIKNNQKWCFLSGVLVLLSSSLSGQDQIKANQTLEISIQGVPATEQQRLNSQYQVSASGYITMWKIGSVRAAGRTKNELAGAIAAAYKTREIYQDPTFQVLAPNEMKLVRKVVTIGGHVKAAGSKNFRDGMTVYQAVQAAGGATAFGALNRVLVYRGKQKLVLNLEKDHYKGFVMRPSDTVEVPEKNLWGR